VPSPKSEGAFVRASLTLAAVVAVAVLSIGAPRAQADDSVELQVHHVVEVSTPVTPTSWDGDIRNLPVVPDWKPGDPVRIVPRRDGNDPGTEPPWEADLDPDSVEPDFSQEVATSPLLDLESGLRADAVASFTTPIVNTAGIAYTGAIPPDTIGDVSPLYYVQSVNGAGGGEFNVYDKTGAKLAGPIQMDSFGTGSCATGFGDPVVLYDQLADRWLMAEFASGGNHLCVYISKTNDPITGGFWAYNFSLSQFPDYPKYAVWPDAYYVTTNESSPAAYALDRTKMLTGAAATFQRFTAPKLAGFGFQALTPGDLDGPTPPPAGSPDILARHRDDEVHNAATHDPAHDFIDLFQFHVDFTTPANSTLTGPVSIPVSEFDSTLCGTSSFSCSHPLLAKFPWLFSCSAGTCD
jgi:hypothetical protein